MSRTTTFDSITKKFVQVNDNKTHKFCPRCSELKPVAEFWRSNDRYDGLQVYCKKCRQESNLRTGGEQYFGLHKRPFPLDGRCEICSVKLGKYNYHHFDNGNPSLGFWVCGSCDYLAEGIDEIDINFWKVSTYHRLKGEVEKVEETYIYFGLYSPPDGIYKLFLNGEQTHKWCSHCGEMKSISKFSKAHSRYDGLQDRCKACKNIYQMSYGNVRFAGLHKRPKSNSCEFCGGETQLSYHHWDDNNKSKGVWVCRSNKCHELAEAVDKLDNGSLLSNRYLELKQGLVIVG